MKNQDSHCRAVIVTDNARWRNWIIWFGRTVLLFFLICLAVLATRLTGPWQTEVARRMACLQVITVDNLDQWTPRVVVNLPGLRFVSFRSDSATDRRYLVVQRWWGAERFPEGFLSKFAPGTRLPRYRRVGGYNDLVVTDTGSLNINGEERMWAEISYERNNRPGKGLLACFGTSTRRFLFASNGSPDTYSRQQALELLQNLTPR